MSKNLGVLVDRWHPRLALFLSIFSSMTVQLRFRHLGQEQCHQPITAQSRDIRSGKFTHSTWILHFLSLLKLKKTSFFFFYSTFHQILRVRIFLNHGTHFACVLMTRSPLEL
uniref:Uncharacterized protein n=1 Tax=Daphnia magna TaxID=35525 RepID=A0A0P6DA15_9CRUS